MIRSKGHIPCTCLLPISEVMAKDWAPLAMLAAWHLLRMMQHLKDYVPRISRDAQRLPGKMPSFWHIALDSKHAPFFGGCHWLVGVEGYNPSLQVATAGALLEIVLKNFISAHDTVDFLAPLALALMCQPSTDQVSLLASPSTGCCFLLALGTKAHCLLSCSTKETNAHVSLLCCRRDDKP